MKYLLLMSSFLFFLPIEEAKAAAIHEEKIVSIQEEISYISDHSPTIENLIHRPLFIDQKAFQTYLRALPESVDLELIESDYVKLSPFLPKIYLRALLYYRHIEVKPINVEKILSFLFSQKIRILQRIANHKESRGKEALQLLQEVTEINNLNLETTYIQLKEVLFSKAKAISEMDHHENFMTALLETKIFTFSLKEILSKNRVPFLQNHGPSLKGNKIVRIKTSINPSPMTSFIEEASETLLVYIPELQGLKASQELETLDQLTNDKIRTNPNFKIVLLYKRADPIQIKTLQKMESDHFLFKKINLSSSQFKRSFYVIDGNSNAPQAIISYFDGQDSLDQPNQEKDSIHVKGPAASLIQFSFVNRVLSDLPKSEQEKFAYFKVTKESIPARGSDEMTLSDHFFIPTPSFKNHDLFLEFIRLAKKEIIIEQRYLLDSTIIEALIHKKRENRDIKIKVFLDTSDDYNPDGFPNSIHMKKLSRYGIQLRTRSKSSQKATSLGYVIVDQSSILINGDQSELAVNDPQMAHSFYLSFIADWSNPEKSFELDIDHFQIRKNSQSFTKDFSTLINDISSFLIKKKLF